MAYAEAKWVDANSIPVVDITPLRDGSDPTSVAVALHAASQGLGFIYIKGHGVPQAVIDAARQTALTFFRGADEDKSEVAVSAHHRGWLGHGGAKMQDDAKADAKESFIWGLEDVDGKLPDDHSLRGPNQWPTIPHELKDLSLDYFNRIHEVAHHLMRGFALGLDLDQGFFLRTASKPLSRCSYVYYPPQEADASSGQFGVGPHTDFGVLTVLCQDDVGGLQVQDVHGDWIHAPPIEGTLVVNVGDLLSRWTDGAYKSTPHRVVNNSGRERLSIVLAFDPDPETMIDACEVFGADFTPKEDPITCGDYLVWRFNKAFSYRKS